MNPERDTMNVVCRDGVARRLFETRASEDIAVTNCPLLVAESIGLLFLVDGVNVHDLRCDADQFCDIRLNIKTFEFRRNDRNFKVGDRLLLREQRGRSYTGRVLMVRVCHMLRYEDYYGVPEGYVVMGIERVNPHARVN